MTMNERTSERFFEEKYQAKNDPWHFDSDAYEQARYKATLDSLGDARFARAFEPGCSIGVLTERLAPLCAKLVAIEISRTAAERAIERCKKFKHVEIAHASLPQGLPVGQFDLIVFSEIGYYFPIDALKTLVRLLVERLTSPGVLLAVHWLGHSTDHILSGDQVHEIIAAVPALVVSQSKRHSGFRIDKWVKSCK